MLERWWGAQEAGRLKKKKPTNLKGGWEGRSNKVCCVATHRESLLELQHHTTLTQKTPSWLAQVQQPRAAVAAALTTVVGSGYEAARARQKTLIAQD